MTRPKGFRGLAALVPVQRGEGERVLLMLLMSLLAVGGVVITGQLAGRALFLSSLPPSAIPLRFILPPLAMIAAVTAYTRAAARVPHDRLMWLTLGAAAAAVLLARLLVATPLGGTLGLLLGIVVLFDVVGGVAMILFWTLAGDLFNPREAKRLFGPISGGSTIANIAFGAFLARYAGAVRPENLILVVLASLLGCAWVVRRITRRYPVVHETVAVRPAPEQATGGTRHDLRELLASPLLVTLGAIAIVVALTSNIADYQLDLALKAGYGADGQGIVGFLALFRLAAGMAGGFLQFVASGLVLRRFGVLPALLMLPVAVGAGGAAILASGGALWAVAIPRAADASLKYTLNDSAINLLYLPLSSRLRARAKAVVDGIVKPPLVALLGLAFYFVGRAGGISLLKWTPALLALVAVWILLLLRASRFYVEALSHSLVMRRLDLGQATIDITDETSAGVVERALAGPDPLRVVHTLALLRGASESDWSDRVAPLLGHADPGVRAEAARYLGDRKAEGHAGRLRAGMDDPDEQARAAAILAYCAARGARALPAVNPRLSEASLTERGAAILGMIRFGGLGGFLHAGRPLHDLLESPRPAERARGAELLGDLAVASFHEPLVELIQDPDREVRRAAIRAGGRLGAVELVPALCGRLEESSLRGEAVEALAACTAGDPARTAGLILDPELPWDARADLCRALTGPGAYAAKADSARALSRLFDQADDRVLSSVYMTLLRVRDTGAGVPVDAGRLEERLGRETRSALAHLVCMADLRRDRCGSHLLEEALEAAAARNRDRLVSLLALLHPRIPAARVRAGLASPDSRARANALELIDTVAPVAKEGAIPCLGGTVEQQIDAARRAGIDSEPGRRRIGRLLEKDDPWLLSCALAVAGRERIEEHAARAREHLNSPNDIVRRTARDAARALGALEPAAQETELMALPPLEKVLFLKQVPLFREIPAEEIASLLPIAEEVRFREGEVILRQGNAGDALYLIVEGQVGVAIDGVGTAKPLGPRDVIGELAILTGDPRAATCTALSEVLALRIERDPFWDLMRRRPEVPMGLLKIVLGYLKKG